MSVSFFAYLIIEFKNSPSFASHYTIIWVYILQTKAYAPARDNYTDAINFAILPRLRELHISAQAGIVHNEVDVEPVL